MKSFFDFLDTDKANILSRRAITRITFLTCTVLLLVAVIYNTIANP